VRVGLDSETRIAPSDSGPSAAGRVLLAALVVVLALGALEVACRIVAPLLEKEPAVPRTISRFDERLGWSLRPGMRAWSGRTGTPIEYRINSRGLRDREIPYAKPAGEFRIVLVGDSHTFGFGVPYEKHYARLLEGYLRNVEVVNTGVGGYGVDQYLLMLQNEGVRYEPDLVVAYVPHYSSFRHTYARRYGRAKPVFELVDGELRLTHSPVPDPHVGWGAVADWMRRHSAAWEFVGRRGEQLLTRLGAIETAAARQRARVDRDWQDEAFVARAEALGSRIVLEMDRVARRHGARFVLVTKQRRTYGLYADAVAAEIPALDVSEALDNERFKLPGRLHHINEAGNGVLAWEIARFLEQQGLVPREHR